MTLFLIWAAVTAVLVLAATGLWVVSVRRSDASIVDPFWGPAFLVAVLGYLLLDPDPVRTRGVLVAVLVGVWAVRLGVHLGIRAAGHGEDPRYAAMRERNGPSWWWRSLFWVFWLQATLVAVISVPLLFAVASDAQLGPIDACGALLFAAGLLFEAVGDAQLTAFRADPANRGRVLDRGLWRWTRHPNYFGDALLWWGLGLFGLAGGGPLVLLAPALMTLLLLRVSGVPLLEERLAETRPGYRAYVARTSAFVPWFPKDDAR